MLRIHFLDSVYVHVRVCVNAVVCGVCLLMCSILDLPNQHIAPQTVPSLAWEHRIPVSLTQTQSMSTLMLKAVLAVTTVMEKYSQPLAYVKLCIRLKVSLLFDDPVCLGLSLS